MKKSIRIAAAALARVCAMGGIVLGGIQDQER